MSVLEKNDSGPSSILLMSRYCASISFLSTDSTFVMLLSVCLKAFSIVSKVYIISVHNSGQSAFLALSILSAISPSLLTFWISWVRSDLLGIQSSSPSFVGMRSRAFATMFSLFFVGSPSGAYELALLATTFPHFSRSELPSESSKCLVLRHLGSHGHSPPPPPPNSPFVRPPSSPATGLEPRSEPKLSRPIPPFSTSANCLPRPMAWRAVEASCGMSVAPPVNLAMPGRLEKDARVEATSPRSPEFIADVMPEATEAVTGMIFSSEEIASFKGGNPDCPIPPPIMLLIAWGCDLSTDAPTDRAG